MKAPTLLLSVTTLVFCACGGEASLGGLDAGNTTSGAGGASTSSTSTSTGSTTAGAGGSTSGGVGGSSAGKGGSGGSAGKGSAGGGAGGKIPIDAGDPCSTTKCPAGSHCVAEPAACIPEAPSCPPFIARCAVACGGFTGAPCPGLGTCADDPSDTCDPKQGGADCPGVCGCTAMAKCMAGQVWDASPAVCGCVAGPGMGGDGGLCGKIQCPAGKVCCNPVMGICADPGMVCIQ